MNKEEILFHLKQRCKKYLAEDLSKTKLYTSIMNILEIPDSFNYIGFITSINLLKDLGFSNDEATKLYAILIS